MNWFILSLLATIVYSFGEILSKYVADSESEPSYIGVLNGFFAALIALSIAFFQKELIFHFTIINSIGLFISAFVVAVGIITYFKALQLSDVSDFALYTRSQILFVFLGGMLLFSERFTYSQTIGTLLMVIGLCVVSITRTKLKLNKGNIYAIITALLFSFGVFIDKAIINDFSPSFYTFLFYGMITALLLIPASSAYRKKIKLPKPKTYIIMFITAFLYMLSAIWTYRAYQIGGMVSLMTVIAQLQIPIVLLYGVLVFKEKERISQKIISMICMVIGAYFLR